MRSFATVVSGGATAKRIGVLTILSALCTVMTATLAMAGTSNVVLNWTGGHCAVCGNESDYACRASYGGEYGDWSNGEKTFGDPVPAGAVVTNVTATVFGVFGCSGPEAEIELALQGLPIDRNAFPGNCSCGDCQIGVLSSPSPEGWPGYNAGGANTLRIDVLSGYVCIDRVELTLEWAPLCGDGNIGAGEQCDDANTLNGDCCSSSCQFEPAESSCASDGNVCTNDICDGAGLCAHVPNAAPCSDGDACTTSDVCSSGVCTAGALVTSCADGDACCIAGCTASVDTDCPAQEILEYVSSIYDDSIDPINGVNGLFSGTDIALSPDGQHIYVAAYTDNLISVFERDPLTGEATWVEAEAGASSALVRVAGVIVSPDGEHVYATNDFYAQSGVSLFDRNPVTGELTYVAVYRQAGFEGARQMVISSDGASLYAIAGADQIVVYSRNPVSGVLTSIQTLIDGVDGVDGIDNTWELAISPDGAHVYVVGIDDNAVAIFSRDTGTGELTFVTALFDNMPGVAFLGRADGVAVSGDGRFVYVNSFDEDMNVFLRDADTGLLTFVERFPVKGGPGKLVVSPDDGRIYASAWVSALNAFGRDVVTDVHRFLETKLDGIDGVVGIEGMQGIAVSPDGQDVYVGSFYDRALTHFRVRCGNGVLEVGEACDDGNGTGGDGCATDCTVEFCWTCTAVPAVQSVCTPDNGKVCNDGLYCTGPSGDTCQAGVCSGPSRTCDDGNQCTEDSCDETANACVNDPGILDGAECDDGAYCSVGDLCMSGACQPGGPRDCADAEECTVDACNESGDVCSHTPKSDGAACVSGASCTLGESCTAGVCGDGTLDAASCADPYLCYRTITTPGGGVFSPIVSLPLSDVFGPVATDVKKATSLCAPTANNGDPLLDAATHLEAYLIKAAKGEPKHVPQTGIVVLDRFGSLTVDTLKARQLFVPTAMALGTEPQTVSLGAVNHFTCYKIKLSIGSPAFSTGLQVSLENQFTSGPKLFDIRKPKALCVPVDKNGEGINEPLANLMCYQVKAAKGEPRHEAVEGQIHTANSFGQEQLDTKKEDVLCVPALVTSAP